MVHAALTLYIDQPDGTPGNDDLGTMSSWAVLSSTGLYPVTPGTPVWGPTTPAFPRIDLTLGPAHYASGHLTITAPDTSDAKRYVQSVRIGGKDHVATYVTSADLRSGRTVAYSVGDRPSRWARDRATRRP